MLIFVEWGKPENLEKNPWSKDKNQQQTQPTYDTGSRIRTQATLVGGERDHHCAIPAPQYLHHMLMLLYIQWNNLELIFMSTANDYAKAIAVPIVFFLLFYVPAFGYLLMTWYRLVICNVKIQLIKNNITISFYCSLLQYLFVLRLHAGVPWKKICTHVVLKWTIT